ncbi:MAG: hypothetical protein LBB85_09385, partial [Dysgonamonadaceae bacterium]|nr:hypothetical protein [Dysgonamonadaceae bacterium]
LVALYIVERIYNYPYRKYGIYTVCTITDVRKTGGRVVRSGFYYFFIKVNNMKDVIIQVI